SVLDPEVPAVRDRRHRDRLREGLSRREVVRFLQEPHPWHRDGHGPVEEVMLHLELELPDAIDEGHERRGVHEALELDVERIEDVLARSHREQLFHRLRGPVAAPTCLVERPAYGEQAGNHLLVSTSVALRRWTI